MTQRRNQDYARTLPRSLPAEVTRTALHERIARADNAGLIVVAAPSGYGKQRFSGRSLESLQQQFHDQNR